MGFPEDWPGRPELLLENTTFLLPQSLRTTRPGHTGSVRSRAAYDKPAPRPRQRERARPAKSRPDDDEADAVTRRRPADRHAAGAALDDEGREAGVGGASGHAREKNRVKIPGVELQAAIS